MRENRQKKDKKTDLIVWNYWICEYIVEHTFGSAQTVNIRIWLKPLGQVCLMLVLLRLDVVHFYRGRCPTMIIRTNSPRGYRLRDRVSFWVWFGRRLLFVACGSTRFSSDWIKVAAKVFWKNSSKNDTKCWHASADDSNITFQNRPVDCGGIFIFR